MPASCGQRSAAPGGQALAQRGLCRLGWLGHRAIVPHAPGSTMERMPSGPYVICLGDAERAALGSLSRRAAGPYRAVLRARIVLLAGRCRGTARSRPGCASARTRPASGGAATARAASPGWPTRRARADRGRSRPGSWPRSRPWPASRPPTAGKPPSRWTCPELARQAGAAGIVASVSASTVRRWLASDAIKPWQHRSWIFPRDPRFALKGGRVLDLYQRQWEDEPLGEDEYVLSADEKPRPPGALARPPPAPRPGHGGRRGSRASTFAAGPWPTWPLTTFTRPRVMGRCEPTTGIKLVSFV